MIAVIIVTALIVEGVFVYGIVDEMMDYDVDDWFY